MSNIEYRISRRRRQRSLIHTPTPAQAPSSTVTLVSALLGPVLVQRTTCELIAVDNHSRPPRLLNCESRQENLQLVSDTAWVPKLPLPRDDLLAFLLRVEVVLPRLISGPSVSPVSTCIASAMTPTDVSGHNPRVDERWKPEEWVKKGK